MLLIRDSHAHLDDPDFEPEAILAQLELAHSHGWLGTLTAGYGPERFERSRALCQAQPRVRRAIGLHPNWLAACAHEAEREAGWQSLLAELRDADVVAVGEIGLDRRDRERWPLEAQQAWLRRGLDLAAERGLPVVLHIVGWHGAALEVLRAAQLPKGGIVHRFSGSAESARAYQSLGLYISLSLEPRSDPARRAALARAIDAERLLIETDWPFGGMDYATCWSALQALVADVAQWRGVPVDRLAAQLERNVQMVYRWILAPEPAPQVNA